MWHLTPSTSPPPGRVYPNETPEVPSFAATTVAAHILSRSFAAEIRKFENCTELAGYCEVWNDVFDMLNGKSAHQDVRTRNALLGPYRSIDVPRYQLLEEKWKYFEGGLVRSSEGSICKIDGASQDDHEQANFPRPGEDYQGLHR